MKKTLILFLAGLTSLIVVDTKVCDAQKFQKPDQIASYILRFDHVATNIRDLKQTADWYNNVFGFRVLHKWNTTWMIGNSAMKIGLFQRPTAKKIDSLDNTIAITHFAFLTTKSGFKKIQQLLKAKHIPFDAPEDTGIAYSIFIYDPDGHQIEVTTYYKQLPDNTAKS